jgi:HEAT repeat protein
MLRSRILIGVALAAIALSGCKGDPSTPEFWSKAYDGASRSKDRLRVITELRDSPHLNPDFLPMLHQKLGSEKNAEIKANIARVLADIKSPSSVEALVDAIDFGNTDSSGNAMNKEIAGALAKIGDPKAIPTLLKLLRSKDNYTKIEAVNALGALKATGAVEPLIELATSETGEPFISKKAIIALGDIGDARAVPSLVRMMFKERRGVSFYLESSFALVQIGGPEATTALIPVVSGADKEFMAWTQENNVIEPAVYAKAAQVLGDLGAKEAEGALLKQLRFENGFAEQLLVRMKAADALGRIRSRAAVPVLIRMLEEQEANVRMEYIRALVRIGDPAAVPALVKAAQSGSWDAREAAVIGVAMLGGGNDAAMLERLAAGEEKIHGAYCKEDPYYGPCSDVPVSAKTQAEKIRSHSKRLAAAAACGKDLTCWVQKLDDADAGVRERAAFEVGRAADAKYTAELIKRLTDTNLDARYAIITAADWLVSDSPEAFTTARASLPQIEKQLSEEKNKTQFVKVNEDLKRLVVKLARAK